MSDVTDYIERQPVEWQPTLRRLRAACRRELPGYSETLEHGMPAYRRGREIEVGFGKQARYLSLYILKEPVLDEYRDALAGLSLGKGCIRYRRPDQIDWDLVTSLLAGTRASSDPVC